ASASSTAIELGGTSAGDGNSFYDQVNVSGALTLGGTLLVSRFGGFEPMPSNVFLILTRASGTGTFNGLPEGSIVSFTNGGYGTITYLAGDGNDVAIFNAIPEPTGGVWLMMLGALPVVRRLRSRSAQRAR